MIPKPPENVVVIRDQSSLVEFCDRMRQQSWMAIDTEFLRERTYYPSLCLVQIADASSIGLIDPLAIADLSPLAGLLEDPGLLKVFHSAEQDLEVLSQRFGAIPAPIFDTQMAAALVGLDDQMGYARLINALLDIQLAKAHTRTDWSQRPLADGALDYAANDVRYLAVAYPVLSERLETAGRTDWLDADFAAMTMAGRFEVDPRNAWRRLKAWHRLEPTQQQVMAALADWREREAMAADRPRRWILADDVLMTLAREQPADRAALDAIRELPSKTRTRHAEALLASIAEGRAQPAQPLAANGGPPDNATKRIIKAGMAQLTKQAEAAGIAASAIASRQDIAALVHGERDGRLLSGWRGEVAGNAVLASIEAQQARQ